MAKNGVFKKITALAMAIALVVCFAVSASAEGITVTTRTSYVTNTDDIAVDVTVSGVPAGANVTYYAVDDTDSTKNVHIDQAKAAAGATSVTFETFRVDKKYLENTVKIGYTGASAAIPDVIDGYKVTLDSDYKYIATEGNGTVTFNYTPKSGYTVPAEGAVSVTSGSVTTYDYSAQNGTLTVTLSGVEADAILSVTDEPSIATEAVPTCIYGKGIIATNRLDWTITGTDENGKEVGEQNAEHNAAAGNRKITVIASASQASECGIIVSSSKIDEKVEVDSLDVTGWDVYQSLNAVDAKAFAVQLIDTSDESDPEAESFIKSGETYYVSVYAKDAGNNKYVVSASAEIAITAAN